MIKLDRLLRQLGCGEKRQVHDQIKQGRVKVNELIVRDKSYLVGRFDSVDYADETVQKRIRRTLVLNKPLGVVSATKDMEHKTVIDLITEEWAKELHLAGRLDRFTSGLMILTNDSQLSEAITEPERKLGKRYYLTCDEDISDEMVKAFEDGMWFEKEGVKLQGAIVESLERRSCRLTLFEGKHHQVKRMFARFGVKVMTLHREAIGSLELDADLKPGDWRFLTDADVKKLRP